MQQYMRIVISNYYNNCVSYPSDDQRTKNA